MQPPERFDPQDPREWLNRAWSNLTLAKRREPDVYMEDLCFECQQATEKALKGLILSRGGEFPYIHGRYPGPARSITASEYEAAVEIAETVVRWTEATLGGS